MIKILLFNIIIILAASVYMNEFILTNEYFQNALENQLTDDQIVTISDMSKKMAWLDHSIAILSYLLKIVVISSILYLVIILNEKTASFSDIIFIVSESFTIFLFPILIKILFLTFSVDTISPDELRFSSFGSLLNFFDASDMENWLKVILASINIWEAIFMVFLAIQLKEYFDNNFKKSMNNVIISYGGGLLTWVIFAAFLAVTFSQN